MATHMQILVGEYVTMIGGVIPMESSKGWSLCEKELKHLFLTIDLLRCPLKESVHLRWYFLICVSVESAQGRRRIHFLGLKNITGQSQIIIEILKLSLAGYSKWNWAAEWIKCAMLWYSFDIDLQMCAEWATCSYWNGRCLAVKLFISCACWLKRFWCCVVCFAGLRARGSCAHYNSPTCPSAPPL